MSGYAITSALKSLSNYKTLSFTVLIVSAEVIAVKSLFSAYYDYLRIMYYIYIINARLSLSLHEMNYTSM